MNRELEILDLVINQLKGTEDIKIDKVEDIISVLEKIKLELRLIELSNSNKFDEPLTELNVVDDLDNILNVSAREKEGDYGPFIDNINRAVGIFNLMTMNSLKTADGFKFMMALKLSRTAYGYKYDTYLDLMAYTGKLTEYLHTKKEENDK